MSGFRSMTILIDSFIEPMACPSVVRATIGSTPWSRVTGVVQVIWSGWRRRPPRRCLGGPRGPDGDRGAGGVDDHRPGPPPAPARWRPGPRSRPAPQPAGESGHDGHIGVLGIVSSRGPAVTPLAWVTAGCSRVATAALASDHPSPPGGLEPAHLPCSCDAAAARRYGLMVMVTVPLTVLSCESCTCMGKL